MVAGKDVIEAFGTGLIAGIIALGVANAKALFKQGLGMEVGVVADMLRVGIVEIRRKLLPIDRGFERQLTTQCRQRMRRIHLIGDHADPQIIDVSVELAIQTTNAADNELKQRCLFVNVSECNHYQIGPKAPLRESNQVSSFELVHSLELPKPMLGLRGGLCLDLLCSMRKFALWEKTFG